MDLYRMSRSSQSLLGISQLISKSASKMTSLSHKSSIVQASPRNQPKGPRHLKNSKSQQGLHQASAKIGILNSAEITWKFKNSNKDNQMHTERDSMPKPPTRKQRLLMFRTMFR
jgi:hypothetical protein